MLRTLPFLLLFPLAALIAAQEPTTPSFKFENAAPAFPVGTGPSVCVDEGHFNGHTAGGTYKPFADLLRSDGFQVEPLTTSFTDGALQKCRVLVVVNAMPAAGGVNRPFPHPSAFSEEEISAVLRWLRAGGSLLLIADHAPYAAAAEDLALLLGVQMMDGYAGPNAELLTGNIVFGAVDEPLWQRFAQEQKVPYAQLQRFLGDPGRLGTHAILQGRSVAEKITSVVSFAGHLFFASSRIEPLLVAGPRATAMIPAGLNIPGVGPEDRALFPVGGWLQGGAVRAGKGRAVILGEAGMCTALWVGPNRVPVGMNSPFANQNPQFCLNAVRWLAGVLEHGPT